jgi:hypothetical protein
MATYNHLPTELTANIFTYLRHERRQPPHAYCIDKLIEYTDDLIDRENEGLTDDGELVYESASPREAREFLDEFVGEAVWTRFFFPYVEAMGYDDDDDYREIKDYREPQRLSWTYAWGDMDRKYDIYDKNGRLNMMPR